MYNREKIMGVITEIIEDSKQYPPYLIICQPRRDKFETPAQNLNAGQGLHIDLLGFTHAYADIEKQKIDVARNYLIEVAIESNAKYLLFVDEDTVLPYDGFLKLHRIAEERGNDTIVGGIYYFKISSPMVMKNDSGYICPCDVSPSKIIEDVYLMGMGCVLIPISLLKKIKDLDPEIPFCCINPDIKNFIGEDTFFYHRARKAGAKIVVNTDVQCLHIDLQSGKYTAHPDINLNNYYTNIPITSQLVLDDKKYNDERWVRNSSKFDDMKLGVIYNVFDGLELLPYSLKNIREVAHHITVVYQLISNRGNSSSIDIEKILSDLKESGLIDSIILYEQNLYEQNVSPRYNELTKRQLGLDKIIETDCTHVLCMDVDELYDITQFKMCQAIVLENNYDSSACKMNTYYKEPIYRLDPKESYYVPWIFKIDRGNPDFKIGSTFPVPADNTRTLPTNKFIQFRAEYIEMEHYSWVRKNIEEKINNSSIDIKNDPIILSRYNDWEYGDSVYYPGIGETKVVKVENKFNIKL